MPRSSSLQGLQCWVDNGLHSKLWYGILWEERREKADQKDLYKWNLCYDGRNGTLQKRTGWTKTTGDRK